MFGIEIKSAKRTVIIFIPVLHKHLIAIHLLGHETVIILLLILRPPHFSLFAFWLVFFVGHHGYCWGCIGWRRIICWSWSRIWILYLCLFLQSLCFLFGAALLLVLEEALALVRHTLMDDALAVAAAGSTTLCWLYSSILKVHFLIRIFFFLFWCGC